MKSIMTPLQPLPASCDVLIIGAGPAGSACAQLLARSGIDVLLVDQQNFPRDKICGDGLIPDSHAALIKLGVYDEVMALAQPSDAVACFSHRGGRVNVPGQLAVLPRKVLDDILCRAEVRAGAKLHTPWRFEAPVLDGDTVVGARLTCGDQSHEVRARWVVLATGAVPQAMIAAGLCQRRTPTGIAMRGYVKNDAMVGRINQLEMVWHKRLQRGYGWVFPCPGGVFNIGVGLVDGVGATGSGGNLREMMAAFCEVHAPARELMATGILLGDMKGAPLRCSLEGALYTRPGLLGTGEVLGSTYAFTGEGIGKAMETGMMAAQAILEGRNTGVPEAQVRVDYEAALQRLKPRFDLYEKATQVTDHPWLMDLLIWRARKSQRVLRRMSAVLDESANPGNLVSLRGIVKLFVPIR
jgi:geranylgeranyl reductase family protein